MTKLEIMAIFSAMLKGESKKMYHRYFLICNQTTIASCTIKLPKYTYLVQCCSSEKCNLNNDFGIDKEKF